MSAPLYLDTARLGETSPLARRTQIEFVRLTAEEPSSAYFEAFLRNGAHDWPERYASRFPRLSHWCGISQLKDLLARIAGFDASPPVLLANRSLELVRFVAARIAACCRHVMLTDLGWPAWQDEITKIVQNTGLKVTTVAVRHLMLSEGLSASDCVNYVSREFTKADCDSLFIPLVNNLGLRFPVQRLIRRLRSETRLRFCAVDGAQAYGHTPIGLAPADCDVFLTGCHKWLRAGTPLGVGILLIIQTGPSKLSPRHLVRTSSPSEMRLTSQS